MVKKTARLLLSVFLTFVLISSVSVFAFAALTSAQAKSKAAEAAGLELSQVTFTKCTETQSGFDVAFCDGKNNYSCTLDQSGKITSYYFDSNKKAGKEKVITAKQAKKIVLDEIEEEEASVTNLKVAYSFDEFDGAVYTVTFLLDSRSCRYEVSAESGEILSYGYESYQTFDSIINHAFAILMKLLKFILKFFIS